MGVIFCSVLLIAGGAKVETAAYDVEMTQPTPAKPGMESFLFVTLKTKGQFHINKQYPFKFKLANAPAGVTFPKPVLQRADGTFEDNVARFRVPFVAKSAGKLKISGTLSLSVVNGANNVMELQTLESEVIVK